MNSSIVSPSYMNSRFGWPKPSRIEEFKKLGGGAGATYRVVFQGKPEDIPIIRIPIDLPKYRLENGRTASLQVEYLAKNPDKRRDLFDGDPEMWDAQQAQHELLLELAKLADLQKYFEKDGNRQVEPILLDENGFVVNGNRRLATWRSLLHKDNVKFGDFQHIDVAVLPHCEPKEIERIEAQLQIKKDIRADYSWDAQANMMLRIQKLYGFSNKEISDLYEMKESDVQELFDMRSYGEQFLKSRGMEDHWSRISRDELAFKKIVTSRPKISGLGRQEIFKEAAFILIDKPEEVGGRLYEAIPSVVEYLDDVKDRLLENFDVKAGGDAKDELSDLFGDVPSAGNNDGNDIPLAREIQKPENVDKARKIIIDVLETQRQIKKDEKSAGYLLDCCAKAHATLKSAVKEGLRPESKLDGVLHQLDGIQKHVDRIRAYVDQHAKS